MLLTRVTLPGEHLLLLLLVSLPLLPPLPPPGPRAHVGHADPGLGVDTQPGSPLPGLPARSLLFAPEILNFQEKELNCQLKPT